jgi:serine O-acetyltransferase
MKKTLVKDLQMIRKIPDDVSLIKLVGYSVATLVYSPGFACVFFYRLNNFLYRRKTRRPCLFLRWWMIKVFGAWRSYRFANEISYKAKIGAGFKIGHVSGIVIGKKVKIGENFIVLNGVNVGEVGFGKEGMPTIGNDVFVGAGAKLLGKIEIGDRVIIGAMAFCNQSIPADHLAYSQSSLIMKIKPNEKYV